MSTSGYQPLSGISDEKKHKRQTLATPDRIPEVARRRLSWPANTNGEGHRKGAHPRYGTVAGGLSPWIPSRPMAGSHSPRSVIMDFATDQRCSSFMCSNAVTLAKRSIGHDEDWHLEDSGRDDGSSNDARGGLGLCGMWSWMVKLVQNYGMPLLLTVFVVQHLLDGFVSRALKISIKFYLRDYGINAGQLQTYQAVVFLPLCARGLMGLASDSFRILGFRKLPWIVITTPMAVIAYGTIGFSAVGSLSMETIMSCFCAMLFHLTFCNVLIDAKNSEKIQELPKHGSDLISFSTLGRTVWSGFAIISIGITVAQIGTRWLFQVSLVVAASTLLPAAFNLIGDDYDKGSGWWSISKAFTKEKGARRYLTLACWITSLSIVLAFFGVLNKDPTLNFVVAMVVASLEVVGFCVFTPPVIAKVAIYHLLVQGCQISLSGVYFYFFTDQPHQYPEGPHFSDAFYVLSFGLVDSVSRLSGVVLYNWGFKHYRYRTIFVLTTLLYVLINLGNVSYCLRWNVDYLGVPDGIYVLAIRAFDGLIGQLNLMPSILLVSHLCPKGREATIYSLIAANLALGSAIGKYNGALVLNLLSIHPKGNPNESSEFDNLWIAALIAVVSNATHVLAVPFLVPDARPDEKLPEEMLVHHKGSMVESPKAYDPAQRK
mmetsp:Transcript_9093/g.17802  ORF Transcript_9093/g.17802 Transcript_9093/m.17802 type:complete len:657 (+) Transcript_9093:173-2143(+)|eukprot:CAMPEP_0167788682 /NCGR_PEP_ID=MMETSP0111_2-20121227/10186_1 /TAXON_ID=91324 /ORGANISM="Lotharella globosa, Strain CCCM811" /LENGTH=656 /DNA_ID=CAMNT_0007680607 /DNA_START=145 /DNA_END=2115 /DNA_ORIENTATION=-